ncbi:MAG TPA: DNA replication and repair protein RecF, partial [Acidimicrobiales bacterium]|nr:DNA replication and repair protein RecF [Acidimicrobiales bacterium]
MHLDHLWITDFRNYAAAELAPAPVGLTVIIGNNGEGKTNLLEAIGYLATLKSFRGSPPDALVKVGSPRAVVRAEAVRDSRRLLIEAELNPAGRDRVQVNRQPLRRARDLLGALQVTVFAPDDLALVKAGPQGRREYLDDLLVALHPRHDTLRSDLDRILRQRNALLKQAGGNPRPDAGIITTLDVWDQKLAETGTALVAARTALVDSLAPVLSEVYDHVAERAAHVTLTYQRSWAGAL